MPDTVLDSGDTNKTKQTKFDGGKRVPSILSNEKLISDQIKK